METKRLEKLIKYCPNCKDLTIFNYTHHREFNLPDEEEVILLRLYRCKKCEVDFSLDHILTYNSRVQIKKINERSRK